MFNNLNSKKIVINVILLLIVGFLLTPNIANAVMTKGCEIPSESSTYKPIKINISLPGISEKIPDSNPPSYHVKDLACFTIGIYTYLVGVIGILATVMIMYGGVKYLVSGGNPTRMSGAKDTIFSAVVGLVLVLGAYMLLNLINPNLTELKVAGLIPIKSAAWPRCTQAAIPDGGGPDRKFCGRKGQDNGEQCRYLDCLESGTVCVKKSLTSNSDDNYECINPIVSCTRINDDEGNTQEDPGVCDEFTIPGTGLCQWWDVAWYNPASAHDRCLWHPVTNCPNATWQQVGCDKCLDPDTGIQGQPRFACERDAGVNIVCETDANTVVYSRDRVFKQLAVAPPIQSICCEKKSNPLPGSTTYEIGDLLCTNEHWTGANIEY